MPDQNSSNFTFFLKLGGGDCLIHPSKLFQTLTAGIKPSVKFTIACSDGADISSFEAKLVNDCADDTVERKLSKKDGRRSLRRAL